MKLGRWIVGAVIVIAVIEGIDSETDYSAEVGYYEGRVTRWHIGEPTTREECTSDSTG